MSFREWTEQLRDVKGNKPHWPWLLGMAMADEFKRQVLIDSGYQGNVFIDRDDHKYQEGHTERRMVQTLYHRCLRDNNGCLKIGAETFWLLGYEWPNQGGDKEKGRRADLIGLSVSGGIVVFECKGPNNADPPLTSMVEGLDYLACLLREKNLQKVRSGFKAWTKKPGKEVPEGFDGVAPGPKNPEIVVLAPAIYYLGRYSRSKRGIGWTDIVGVGDEAFGPFQVRFAASDFNTSKAQWIK